MMVFRHDLIMFHSFLILYYHEMCSDDDDDEKMVRVVKHLFHLNSNEIILGLLNYYLLKEILNKYYNIFLLFLFLAYFEQQKQLNWEENLGFSLINR